MSTGGLEVRFREGRERAEVERFTTTLDEITRLLREIDRVYLQRSTRASWVIADLAHSQSEMIVRLEARPVHARRDLTDMLVPVTALVAGAESLQARPEVPQLFKPTTVTRLAGLAGAQGGIQQVSIANYNGKVREHVELSDELRLNAGIAVKAFDISYGTVTGVLDALGGRRRTRDVNIGIHDPVQRRVVPGVLPARLEEQAREMWRHRVIALGKVKRNQSGQAIRVDVDRIELQPDDSSNHPDTRSLLGVDPGWIGGVDVDEYLREVRGD